MCLSTPTLTSPRAGGGERGEKQWLSQLENVVFPEASSSGLCDIAKASSQSFLAYGFCPHGCKMAPQPPGINSISQAVRRGKADGKRPDTPAGGFPASRSNAALSFWPRLCPKCTLDARMVRNVALGSKHYRLRRNWTSLHREEGQVATGEAVTTVGPRGQGRRRK